MKKYLAIALFIMLVFVTYFVVKVFYSPLEVEMSDISMNPTIPLGDVVRFEKASNLKRGDVIVYKSKHGLAISRIAGMPGEHISLLEKAFVTDLKIVYGFEDLRRGDSERTEGKRLIGKETSKYQWKLSYNQFLVICDNPEISAEGRVGGPIYKNQILGRLKERKSLGSVPAS